jgi:hypothetical protein
MFIINMLRRSENAQISNIYALVDELEGKYGEDVSIQVRVQAAYQRFSVDGRSLGYPENLIGLFPQKRSWSHHDLSELGKERMLEGLRQLDERREVMENSEPDYIRPDSPPLNHVREVVSEYEVLNIRTYNDFEVMGPGADEIIQMLVGKDKTMGVSSMMLTDINRWGEHATFGIDDRVFSLEYHDEAKRIFDLCGVSIPEERVVMLWNLFRRLHYDQAASIKVTRLFNQSPFNFMFGFLDRDFEEKFGYKILLGQQSNSRRFHLYSHAGHDKLVIIYSGNIGRFFNGALGIYPDTAEESVLGEFRAEAVINLENNSAMVRTYARLYPQGISVLEQLRQGDEERRQSELVFADID